MPRSSHTSRFYHQKTILGDHNIKNSTALARERTIPTERPPPVGEVSANFCGQRGVTWSAQRIPTAVNLFSRPEPPLLLFK
jgi:hypothetical protein